MKSPGLRDFLQAEFRSEPLKPVGLRARNALKPWLIPLPQRAMSYRITTADGRRFKLLDFAPSIQERHDAIESRLRQLDGLACAPSLVWRDERGLLVEWVEGETPRADDPRFARALASAFAALYRVGYAERDRSEVLADVRGHADALLRTGRLRPGDEKSLAAALAAALPARVPTSMLCGDQNLANFVIGPDGALAMIDPGSFQPGLPIDIFFVGGPLYDAIDRAAFHEAYAHAGGIAFPFEHALPLTLIQLVRHCALQSRVLDRTSAFERRRRRNLQRSVDEKLARLRTLLSSV